MVMKHLKLCQFCGAFWRRGALQPTALEAADIPLDTIRDRRRLQCS